MESSLSITQSLGQHLSGSRVAQHVCRSSQKPCCYMHMLGQSAFGIMPSTCTPWLAGHAHRHNGLLGPASTCSQTLIATALPLPISASRSARQRLPWLALKPPLPSLGRAEYTSRYHHHHHGTLPWNRTGPKQPLHPSKRLAVGYKNSLGPASNKSQRQPP